MAAAAKKSIGTVPDDRGTSRPVVAVTELFSDSRMNDPAFAAVCERVLRLKSSGMRIGRTIVVAVLVALGIAAVSIVLRNFTGVRSPSWVPGVVTSVFLVIFTTWYLRRFEKKNAPEVARILLADGLCPSCAYTLADIPAEPDACIVCPECGGAWSSGRVVRQTRYQEHTKGSPRVRGLKTVWHTGIGTGAVHITDDAGCERPLASPRLKREIAVATGERRERLIAAAKANLTGGRIVRWGIGGVYLCAGLGMFVFVYQNVPIKAAWIAASVAAVLAASFGVFFLRGSAGVTAPWMRKRMLARGLCPSCAADLPAPLSAPSGTDQSHPGHTQVCAECGGMWNHAPGPA